MIHRLPLTVSTYILYSQITDIYSVNERVGVFVVSAHRLIWPWRFLKLNTRKKKYTKFGQLVSDRLSCTVNLTRIPQKHRLATVIRCAPPFIDAKLSCALHMAFADTFWISATIEYDIQSVSTSFYYLTIEQQAEYSHLVYFFFPLASSSFKIHFYIYVCCAFRGFVCVQRALQMRRVECEWTNLLHCVVHNLPSIFGRRVDGAASTHNSLIK